MYDLSRRISSRRFRIGAKYSQSFSKSSYEVASGALELGILLASTSIVTGVAGLVSLGSGFGLLGAVLGVLGWIVPHLIGGLVG